MAKKFRLRDLDLKHTLDEATYEASITSLQAKLAHVQQAYFLRGHRAVIVLEGVDAAGKGGLVRRVAWALDPRGFQVWPIGAPNEIERGQHWMQRFWSRMPSKGQIACFDRSWYGRVLVERVEALAPEKAWRRAYDEIGELEGQLVAEGIRVVKLLLVISPEEQLRRFEDRLRSPRKRWKLTFEDFRNRSRSKDYDEAFEEMVEATSFDHAPWHVVASDSKKWARLKAMEILVEALAEGVDTSPPEVDPRVEALARQLGVRA